MGIGELLILLALMAATLTGCSGPERDEEGDGDFTNDGVSGSKGTEEELSEADYIDAVKTCAEENGQPCVCGALVQCTSAINESETAHMVKLINHSSVKVAEIAQLSEEDIQRDVKFSGCKYSVYQNCILPVEDWIIEGNLWQDINKDLKVEPDGSALDAEWSYMICNFGQGIIYFKDSGQDFKDAIHKEADSLFGRGDEFANLSEDEILLVTAIYGEAADCSKNAWEAIANVIMNRVGTHEWKKYTNPVDIIKYTGFDAYNNPNEPYRQAKVYFENRDYSNSKIEEMVQTVIPILRGEAEDITGGCVLYYSPEAQKALHKEYPQAYPEVPGWTQSPKVEYVEIDGLENDDFKFYRYID